MVRVIRRPDRTGFKAGNLNNALRYHIREPYFAVIDADEIVPTDFLSKLVPYLNRDPDCGFVQANHRCADVCETQLQEDMRIGIDVHWKWYQSLRNKFGFVMFLGHGALLRRSCCNMVGGFQEIVSEDLAYAIAIRQRGYYGVFAENVTCTEAFPETVQSFRTRHVKWTRGTCEFLSHWAMRLLRSKTIPWIEKCDILFPTANLPMTLFFFIFMILAGIILPLQIGEWRALTLAFAGWEWAIPTLAMPQEMNILYTWDFFAITVLTLFAPILCFILEHWRTPFKLFRFLAHSTTLYAALSPLSALCVFGYMITGKARFLVTGDKSEGQQGVKTAGGGLYKFFCETLPDSRGVRYFEIAAGLLFLMVSLISFQVAFFGLAIGFVLHPLLSRGTWSNAWLRRLGLLPFSLIMSSVLLGGSSFFAVQTVLFGFGFHF
jgi:cellulose synthase/poly-beta-1,6-N-acetylglucosamine synthase-like glycosyltransferase